MYTKICEDLGIEVPIFAFSHCRDVVVEVSKAGGLGVLGAPVVQLPSRVFRASGTTLAAITVRIAAITFSLTSMRDKRCSM